MNGRPAQQLWLDVAGLRLSLLAWGPPDGEPLLALHGWLDNAHSFAPLAATLPGRRLLALELPGHGHSAHLPACTDYHLLDSVPLLERLLERLGLAEVELMGHSMGAVAALYYAIAAPRRVSRLLLLDALGPPSEPAARAGGRLVRAARQRRLLERRPQAPFADLPAAIAARRRRGFLPDDDSLAALLLQRGLARCADGAGLCWRHDPRLLLDSTTYPDEAWVLAMLAELHTETRLLMPDEGLFIRRATRAERIARPSALRLVEVAGGHYAHMEQAALVAHRLGLV